MAVIGINNRANHNDNKPNSHSDEEEILQRAEEIREYGRIKEEAAQVYQCIAEYATTFLLRKGDIVKDNGVVTAKLLADVLENYIVWIQTVKCNPPDTENNVPHGTMWKNCPTYILKGELKILEPRHIIVLGLRKNGGNFNRIKTLFCQEMNYELKSIGFMKKEPKVERFSAADKISGNCVGILGVPHPSHSRFVKTESRSEKIKVNMKLGYLDLP